MFMLKSLGLIGGVASAHYLLPEGQIKTVVLAGLTTAAIAFSLAEYRRIRAQEESIENNLNAILDKISRLPPEQASRELDKLSSTLEARLNNEVQAIERDTMASTRLSDDDKVEIVFARDAIAASLEGLRSASRQIRKLTGLSRREARSHSTHIMSELIKVLYEGVQALRLMREIKMSLGASNA